MFIASDDSISRVFKLLMMVEKNPRSTFIYVAVKLIDLRPSILKIAVVSNKKNGISGFLFPFFFSMLFRLNACGDNLL